MLRPFDKVLGPFAKVLGPFDKVLRPFNKVLRPFAKVLGPFAKVLRHSPPFHSSITLFQLMVLLYRSSLTLDFISGTRKLYSCRIILVKLRILILVKLRILSLLVVSDAPILRKVIKSENNRSQLRKTIKTRKKQCTQNAKATRAVFRKKMSVT